MGSVKLRKTSVPKLPRLPGSKLKVKGKYLDVFMEIQGY